MRLHLSLGHLRLDLTICEDEEAEPGEVHDLTATTEIPAFGFTDEGYEDDPAEERT